MKVNHDSKPSSLGDFVFEQKTKSAFKKGVDKYKPNVYYIFIN